MLILAGVSINAIIGENGLLTKSQYATFLSEMAAVEEAVGMWKAGEAIEAGGQTTAIPTNGMCKSSDVTSAERLTGEVGYYRVWGMSGSRPTTNILSSASEFNSAYNGELVTYPAGVQDLYYLNNEACGIDSKKTYLIDAATGMVYSMAGINLKGVACYSSNMAKAVMNGDATAPNFAEAEVSGSGSGEKLAGNVQNEYLYDENGNLLYEADGITPKKNSNYNPNGFQIIANSFNDNIYKLYNNGDLYAKGVKGTQLNTPTEQMEKLNCYKWNELKIPSEIGNYKKVIVAASNVYVIDINGYLWSWGNNNNNKLGLTQEEQVEFTGREAVKLNIDGKQVENVWDLSNVLFVLTKDNYLYSAGYNNDYFLGLGHNNEVKNFQQVEFPDPQNIKSISRSGEDNFVLIECKDNTYYAVGQNAKIIDGTSSSGLYKKFVPMWNGYVYKEQGEKYVKDDSVGYLGKIDIDQDIQQVVASDVRSVLIVKKDGQLVYIGGRVYGGTEIIKNTYEIQTFNEEFGNNVKSVYGLGHGLIILQNNGKVWGSNAYAGPIGLDYEEQNIVELSLPEDLSSSGIKEILTFGNNVLWLSNDNELFISSNSFDYVSSKNNIEKMEIPVKMKSLILENYNFQDANYTRNAIVRSSLANAIGEDGKIYIIGDSTVLFKNEIIQGNWKLIASNVSKFSIGNNSSMAYIDKENKNLFVLGNDARILGLNISERKEIEKFTLVDDALINGKVKDIQFSINQMYVLTTDNILYSTGLWSGDGTTNFSSRGWPGWSEHENKYNLVPILEDVRMISISEYIRLAVTSDSYYTWGFNYGNIIRETDWTPQVHNISSILDPMNISKIYVNLAFIGIITNDNKFYTSGSSYDSNVFQISLKNTSFIERNKDFFHFENPDEYVTDFCMMKNIAALVLTNKGNVYGWGQSDKLGIGTSSQAVISSPKKLISNVSQIISGNGFFVVTKEDGTVWGTGSNQYGVLGRWKGAPRESGRYRTAFEWVECPELEI